MSAFTKHLKALYEYSKKYDDETATLEDWLTLQRYEAEYTDDLKAKALNIKQYGAINRAWHDLMDKYRATVKGKKPAKKTTGKTAKKTAAKAAEKADKK